MRPTLETLRRHEEHVAARAVSVIVVALVCAATFTWIHASDLARTLAAAPHNPSQVSEGRQVLAFGLSALGQWALFAFAGLAIAYRTRRPDLILLPGVLFVTLPAIVSGGVHLQAFADYYGSWGQPTWISALTDLSLAVVPGLFAALIKPGRVWQIRRHEVLALALISVVVAAVAVPRAYHESGTFDLTTPGVVRLVAMLAIGFGIGVRRKTFPWLQIALAFLAADGVGLLVQYFMGPAEFRGVIPSHIVSEFWGPAGAILAGSLCPPFAGYLRTRSLERSEQRVSA